MNPVEFKIVGGPTGDPCVRWRAQHSKVACLFDFGSVSQLEHRELTKTLHAFVSHAHMDHFHGFDAWLRVHVPVGKRLFVYGPRGMARHVQSKLHGYLWNLIGHDQLFFEVKELHGDGLTLHYHVRSSTDFALELQEERRSSDQEVVCLAELDERTRVFAAVLDHGTEVLGFSVEYGPQYKLDLERVKALGKEPGAWIKDIAETDPLFREIFSINYLRALTYITDIGFTEENLRRVALLGKESLDFICETNYRASESEEARKKMHLTTEQAAKLAQACGAQRLHTFHVSNIYRSEAAEVLAEAQHFFGTNSKVSQE